MMEVSIQSNVQVFFVFVIIKYRYDNGFLVQILCGQHLLVLLMSKSRLSGLQQDVLSLYRRVIREAMKKDRIELQQLDPPKPFESNVLSRKTPDKRPMQRISFLQLRRKNDNVFRSSDLSQLTTTAYTIGEFRKQALSVQQSDFKKIDYMIRKCDKHIKLLRMPGVKLVSGTTATLSANNPISSRVSSERKERTL
jgi:hypothetical protein